MDFDDTDIELMGSCIKSSMQEYLRKNPHKNTEQFREIFRDAFISGYAHGNDNRIFRDRPGIDLHAMKFPNTRRTGNEP